MNLEDLIKSEGAVLVDVKNTEEFEENTLPGAINIPLHTIPLRVEEIKSMKGPVIVFCRSGARSYQATTWLKHKGIEVHDGGAIANMMQMVR